MVAWKDNTKKQKQKPKVRFRFKNGLQAWAPTVIAKFPSKLGNGALKKKTTQAWVLVLFKLKHKLEIQTQDLAILVELLLVSRVVQWKLNQ
jgi:hypothetical protein